MKSKKFRQLLRQKPSLLLCGAHDALSAKLIEEAGFDAIWVSSFGISAATKCMPDANVLTMTEALEAAKGINEAVSIPVIADCDNGYGNAHNVIRMVREYERAGIAGISIEDNPFPKKCSLYPGERPELVDIDEMAGRIHAATSTRRNRDFFVIARTEALIAGLGMEEALERAKAYEAAGADAILIHSRRSTPDEIRQFASRWTGKVPLVCVPTKYPKVTVAELRRMGIRVVIFANQALRASVTAMQKTLKEMKKAQSLEAVDSKIAPLSDIFRLVGQPNLEANDEKYVKNFKRAAPRAIIVAAGFDRALWPLNSDKPKAMLDIHGKSLLERQVEILKKAGIARVAVVTGYKSDKVRIPSIVTYHNPRFRQTHILHSLFLAQAEMQDRFLFMYGDVLVDEMILEKLLRSKSDITLVVDRVGTRSQARVNPEAKRERDWVILRKNGSESMEVAAIGHHLRPEQADGEFAGLALFSRQGALALRQIYARALASNGAPFHNAPDIHHAQFTDLVQEILKRKQKVSALCVRGGWLEIDSFEDYRNAWQALKA